MNQKNIDTIVWWIPFKKTRNAVRGYLRDIHTNAEILRDIHTNTEILRDIHTNTEILRDIHTNAEMLKVIEFNTFLIASKNNIDRVGTTAKPFGTTYYKYLQILHYGIKHNIKICIETGTFLGEAADTCKDYFDKFYTIELLEELFSKANEKFKDTPKVITLKGDSTDILPKILADVKEECLFWLDGHYSGNHMGFGIITAKGEKDTPIMEELEAIFNHGNYHHVILIDDAVCFGHKDCPSYPTLEELEKYVKTKRPNCKYEVYDDIIRIVL